MKLAKLIEKLEIEFPSDSAWSGDSVGLQIDTQRSDIKKVYVTLELDQNTVNEAIENKVDLIITFHPLIFNPLKRIEIGERVSDVLIKLVSHNIGLYCIHTNLDAHPNGTNKFLANKLNLEVSDYLDTIDLYEDRGMGIITESGNSITTNELAEMLVKACKSPIRATDISNKEINRIAIVAGSGSGYIDNAISKKCDAIITADVKYHDFHRANGKIEVFDPGHYEMEQFVIESLYENISNITSNEIEIVRCTKLTNPIKYFPEGNYLEEQKKNLKIK